MTIRKKSDIIWDVNTATRQGVVNIVDQETMTEVMSMLTLEAARVNCGLNLVDAAKLLGIHRDTLWKYEQDSTKVSREFEIKVKEVYRQPKGRIFFGRKSEFFRIRSPEYSRKGEAK
ncbi:helix-turn-helix transcriptional regulator [Paenibacillus sp. FSL K6-1318]|uniref:helix-turn-helix transcriptional regulator n=1 Tax=Paenibacillus sp. FSL K6-1318 TaxID=2975291 RepID=UPI0030ED2587